MKTMATASLRTTLAGLLAAAAFLLPNPARAEGRVVVYSEDWSTSDSFYSPSAQAFGLNVFNWLTNCNANKQLLFDDTYNLYLPYTQMDAALVANGFTITRLPTASWTPALLAGYDAVMVENAAVDAAMLNAYQIAGGNLFVIGGGETSHTLYNPLLAYYNLSYSPIVNSPEITTTFVAHPITTGVVELRGGRPSPINVTGAGPVILSTHGGINWIAIAGNTGPCLPTPARRSTWGSVKERYR